MTFQNISIIGLGLIGGSIAKTLRRIYPDINISGYDINTETLNQALKDNVLNKTYTKPGAELANSDLIFLATPVSLNTHYLNIIKPFISKDCIISDVGSVKKNIHMEVEKIGLDYMFIGGHPMSGLEKNGYEHSNDRLFENIYYLVTPGANISNEKVNEFTSFLESIGTIPAIIDYESHDYMTSTVSHLPHILAFCLVNIVKSRDSNNQMKKFAAGGFKDITRIASSSSNIWQPILSQNKSEVLTVISEYINSLEKFADAITLDDKTYITREISSAKSYRDSLPSSSLSIIKKTYQIYCDIIDEAGNIAKIATLLSNHGINIKNIGIENSREFVGGVLRIEIYTEKEYNNAIIILRDANYKITDKE